LAAEERRRRRSRRRRCSSSPLPKQEEVEGDGQQASDRDRVYPVGACLEGRVQVAAAGHLKGFSPSLLLLSDSLMYYASDLLFFLCPFIVPVPVPPSSRTLAVTFFSFTSVAFFTSCSYIIPSLHSHQHFPAYRRPAADAAPTAPTSLVPATPARPAPASAARSADSPPRPARTDGSARTLYW